MKPPMNQSVQVVSTTRNKFGDIVNTAGFQSTIKCKFREIADLGDEVNREVEGSLAMMWTNPDSGVDVGSVILFDDKYYRVANMTVARRLHSVVVQFLKFSLVRIKDVANVS
jgi:hypothetical protein